MKKRPLIYGLLLLSLAGCDHTPQTFANTVQLQKEVGSVETLPGPGTIGRSVVHYSVKFDRSPVEGHASLGTAYYRADITNRSDRKMAIKQFHLQFVDELQIAIEKCSVIRSGFNAVGATAIWLQAGETFSKSGNCTFPISQMELIERISTSVDYNFWE